MNNKKLTKQKSIIIEYLEKNKGKYLKVQDIFYDLHQEIGMTTIYRIVNSLVEEHKISKIPLKEGQGFYYIYRSDEKYYCICEKCNNVFQFEKSQITQMLSSLKNEFEINNNIIFYGICKKCQNRENIKKNL